MPIFPALVLDLSVIGWAFIFCCGFKIIWFRNVETQQMAIYRIRNSGAKVMDKVRSVQSADCCQPVILRGKLLNAQTNAARYTPTLCKWVKLHLCVCCIRDLAVIQSLLPLFSRCCRYSVVVAVALLGSWVVRSLLLRHSFITLLN